MYIIHPALLDTGRVWCFISVSHCILEVWSIPKSRLPKYLGPGSIKSGGGGGGGGAGGHGTAHIDYIVYLKEKNLKKAEMSKG